MLCNACPIAPAVKALLVWSYTNAFAIAAGPEMIVPNRLVASTAADMEDAKPALASAIPDGPVSSVRNDSATHVVTNMDSAKTAPVSASPAGTANTALLRAARAIVPNEANANRRKEAEAGAAAVTKAGKDLIVVSLSNWNAMTVKTTIKTACWIARTLTVAPHAIARNLRSASRLPNPSTSCYANNHRP